MNDLSWMLYWADVLPAMSTSLILISVFGSIAALIALVIHLISAYFAKTDEVDAENARQASEALKFSRWLLPVMVALGMVSNLIPSRDTFYAIAASEMGEEALKSPIATKASKALEKWLDSQIDDGEEAK